MTLLAPDVRAKVYKNFLDQMKAVYATPRHLDGDSQGILLALDDYAEELARFTHVELAEGWRRLRRKHQYRTWPTIRDCLEACRTAPGSEDTGRKKAPYIPPIRHPRVEDGHFRDWTPEEIEERKRWIEIARSPWYDDAGNRHEPTAVQKRLADWGETLLKRKYWQDGPTTDSWGPDPAYDREQR